jgi:hypothetical protein
MKKISGNFLIIVGLIMALGMVSTVSAYTTDDTPKRPKNTGILSVKTNEPLPVLVDGVQVGVSGVNEGKEFYLTPGTHRVEIQNPYGAPIVRDIDIIKDRKNCICLKVIKTEITTPCPYRVEVAGPENVKEGDLITFFAQDRKGSPTALRYVWTVLPAGVRITSGQGTSSITVDSTGFPAQDIRADVDVSDGSYDEVCRQRIPVKTFVTPPPTIPPPPPFEEKGNIVFRAFDEDKSQLDRYAIELQNRPDVQSYIIIYQGREKKSLSVDKMAKRSLDYLVKTRGVDPRRIVLIQGGSRLKTMADLFVVPPGATTLPVPTPN